MHSESAATTRVEIAVAVVQRDESFLIGLRPEGVALAGYWEFPGGKVSADELPADAVARECLEETGLKVRVTGAYPPVEHDYPHARLRLSFFACAPVEQQRPLPSRFRWVPAAELGDYKFPPANDALVRQLTGAGARRPE